VSNRQIEAGLCVPAWDRRPAQPRRFERWPVRRGGGGRPRLVAAVALAAGLAALVLPAGAGAAPDCQTSGAETVCTFEYTGAAETWTVPYGVSESRFDVYGAEGGALLNAGAGGLGGRATATIAVTAAQTLQVNVGGAGKYFTAGFNGGGSSSSGGAGGGGSDVRFAPYELADRAIVAGGGGGSGAASHSAGGRGGAGGGTGGNGADSGDPSCCVAQGGGGGTQTAGGAGGSDNGSWINTAGRAGGFGSGGGGGSGSGNGGGGGGGYWGGGGGAGNDSGIDGGGGGGGGSGFGPAGVVFESGVRDGDGLVTISYTTSTDAGAPTSTIALDPAGPDGQGGWYVSTVQAKVVAVDDAGGWGVSETRCVLDPASVPTSFADLPAGCPYADGAEVAAEGEHVLYAASRDHAGKTEVPVKQVFKLDRTAPTVSCEADDGRWHASDARLGCSASDSGAGLADAADAQFSLTTNVAPNGETANAATAGRTVEDAAGNSTTAGPIDAIKVDKLAPAITIEAPTASGYPYGQAVVAAYGCDDGGSGVVGCAGPVAAGQQIGTATAGAQTFTVTATDRAGNTTSRAVDYTVASPPPPSLRLGVARHSVFGPRAAVGCRMADGPIRSCRVRLLAGGRVVARGTRSARAGRSRLRVALALTAYGRWLLEQRLGGLPATVTATGTVHAGSARAKAPTRALLAVERFTTPAGAWLPNQAQLSSRGKRFVRGLRGELIAVAALRCDGHAARVRPHALHAQALSRARAVLICSALNRLAPDVPTTIAGHGDNQPLAPNSSPAGRAHNRRVEVTLQHQT
jgi:hypothetical protein